MLVPNGSVSRTDVVYLHAGELLECLLNRNAILAHNVGVVAAHLVPVDVAIHVGINERSCKRTEASEGVAREQYVGWLVEGSHRFGPMHHWNHGER